MSDLRAAVAGLPWNVWQEADEPVSPDEREWGVGIEWYVGEYRSAVLSIIPEGSVLVTEAALAEALHGTRVGCFVNDAAIPPVRLCDEYGVHAEQARAIIARLRGEK